MKSVKEGREFLPSHGFNREDIEGIEGRSVIEEGKWFFVHFLHPIE